MNAEEIRRTKLEGAGGLNYPSHYERDCALFLKELAAQVAEVNDKLNIVLNPPIMYDMTVMEPRMTLRDQFAMAALSGLLSDPSSSGPDGAAMVAYKYADSMMKARK